MPNPNDADQLTADTGGNPLSVIELLTNGLDEALSLSYPEQGGPPDIPSALLESRSCCTIRSALRVWHPLRHLFAGWGTAWLAQAEVVIRRRW